MDRKIDNLLKAMTNSDRKTTKKVNAISTHSPENSGVKIKDPSKLAKHVQFVNTITLVKPNRTNDEANHETILEVSETPKNESTDEVDEVGDDYFNKFPTEEELPRHPHLVRNLRHMYVRKSPRIKFGNPWNLNIPCCIGHIFLAKAYIDRKSPINIMTSTYYNWVMKKPIPTRQDPNNPRVRCNFLGRVKGLPIYVGSFTYLTDFIVVDDISTAIDPSLSHVILGKPFIENTGMTYDLSLGIMRFKDETDDIAYQMPFKIENFHHYAMMKKNLSYRSTIRMRRIRTRE